MHMHVAKKGIKSTNYVNNTSRITATAFGIAS